MNKLLVVMLIAFCLSACGRPPPPWYGEVRERLFVQCMQLAKDTVKEGYYNDNAEVVAECSQQSRFMARSYKQSGVRPQAKDRGDTAGGSDGK